MYLTSDLPPDLQTRLAGRDLIVFDGVCVLCSGFFRFVLRHDHRHRFHFATAQGDLGQALYRTLGLPTDAFETNLVIVDGRIYTKAQAFGAVMGALGGGWKLAALPRVLPGWLTDPAYHLIARNRYRLFGRTETCMLPTPEIQHRFLA